MDTAAPPPGEPLPVELMNTVRADRDGVYDTLDRPEGATEWLAAVSARTALPAAADFDALTGPELARLAGRLTDLRGALRRLAAEATGDPRPAALTPALQLADAVAALNAAAGETPHWSALSWTPGRAPERHTRTGGRAAAAALSALAEESVLLFCGEARHDLRACLAPGCVLYFTKNHPRREWCSPGCGNRARSARHYRRHRHGSA
ncbi:CGNR zinc finger domain-containing protein [Streptomyces sp. NPDC047002]|uniref:CGNR zinc finger domain-containing protein n=1 Tax=Streptomyces sp. NPDC047002 TaxID=3155475 RepID=UPI003455113F